MSNIPDIVTVELSKLVVLRSLFGCNLQRVGDTAIIFSGEPDGLLEIVTQGIIVGN
jgi:hypothetical protein